MERKKHAILSELVTPEMANVHGTMFGGDLLALIDKAAYIAATRWSQLPCVTASLDQISFLAPIAIGSYVSVYAEILHIGKSSMTIEVEARAEDLKRGQKNLVCQCIATMVALKDGRPTTVPGLGCRTIDQKKACLLGYLRKKLMLEREARLKELAQEINAMDDESLCRALAETETGCKLCNLPD